MDEHFPDSKTPSSHQTPGQLLKQAREAQSLSPADVAQKMRLSTRVIKEIEEDQYDLIGAVIYVRGYLRAYAKILQLSEALILDAFDAQGYTFEPDKIDIPLDPLMAVSTSSYATRRKRRLMQWATVAMSLLLIVLVVIWWNGQRDHAHSAAITPSFAIQVVNPTAASSTPTATTQAAPVSQQTNKTTPMLNTVKKPQSAKTMEKTVGNHNAALHADYQVIPISNE